jgi:chorismate mutase
LLFIASKLALDILPLNSWLNTDNKPVVIAGPCSAETEEQVHEVARGLAQIPQVKVMRAGIWKPRTRPGSFEGMGSVALPWLVDAAKQNGLLSACEIATPKHVEEALKAGVDVLWIGARTTVNPFSVQDIADALQGVDVPVMVKNPVAPDLQLWIGAIERVASAGINKIIGVHRGFQTIAKTKYRNNPLWELAIEFKTHLPGVPLFVDPSHIAGKSELVADVAQKALDMDMDGLMIETHPNPANALSDARQQITPAELAQLVSSLELRSANSNNLEFQSRLEELRSIMDSIDEEILRVIARRMAIAEKIGEYKYQNHVTILQIKRWKEILATRTAIGNSVGLDEEFVKALMQLIHKESIHVQTELVRKQEGE